MRLLIFTFTLITATVFATTPDSLKQKKWAIGLTYSPDFCYRVSYEKSSFLALANIKESPKYGFTSGVNILYQLLDRVGVEFGVLYNNKGEKMYSNSSSSSTWTTPDGTSASYAIKETKSTLAYQYLEIPLKINVNLVNKNKLKLFPSLGCSMNVFMGKNTTTTFIYDDGHKEKNVSHEYEPKNIPTSEFSLLVGVGVSYDLNQRLFLKLEPSFRTFIRPLVDSPVSGTLYSVGANAGIYMKF